MPYIKQPPHHHKPNKDSKEPNHEFCKRCGLILHRGRWQKNEALVKEQKKKRQLTVDLCSACRKEKEGIVEGVLTIDRAIFESGAKEIQNEIKNIAKLEFNRDPLKRITGINLTKDKIIVNTLTMELAVTIGKHLKKSRKGKLEIHYSPHEDFAEAFLTANK